MKYTKKEVFSIPNCLGYFRILLIPVFIFLYVKAETKSDYHMAAGIILLSGFTDFLDGFIARTFRQITELGKALDPIADKLTQGAIIIALMFKIEKMWMLVLFFICKEAFMGINGFLLLRRGKRLDGAMWFGKVSTAVFYLCTFVLICFPSLPYAAVISLMLVTAFFLALSFLLYIPVFARMYKRV
ncbi:MAG: CDP-alcohol phosphatidyltransferase family protein [Lachnospiraceae bacterium]|nr:CDP-alcohol phosphatidyltransferase family protein [Lachnospiraceae bacterium]